MDYVRQHEHETEDDSCPMIMTLHAGSCEAILFKNLQVHGPGQLVLAIIIIFLISIAYEGVKFWREKLYNEYIKETAVSCSSPSKEGASEYMNRKTIRQLLTHKIHLIQTVLHLIQVTASYALMLIVMTYNVWLVLAVILGATVGYFSFGWIRQRTMDVTESCCH